MSGDIFVGVIFVGIFLWGCYVGEPYTHSKVTFLGVETGPGSIPDLAKFYEPSQPAGMLVGRSLQVTEY